jgi:SAM-dependent methyltransferase
MPPLMSYSDRFQNAAAVESYEGREYGPGSYAATVWQGQLPVLERTLKAYRAAHGGPVRLLDFACGTGRVLAGLAPWVDAADGVDISEAMVAVARGKCPGARLAVGDILTRPDLLQKEYEVISCFRFLLNAEPALRGRVLRRLREVLRSPDGMLLVNVHGNARSLRHPALVWRRRRERSRPTGEMLNEMTAGEARKLLADNGFEVVNQQGYGMLPPSLHRTWLRPLVVAADRSLAGTHWWNRWSIDMLFICRPN